MSVRYVPVQWNRNKWIYDGILIAGVVGYLTAFLQIGAGMAEATRRWMARFSGCARSGPAPSSC